ncbi:hypothetical protein Tco_0643277 [Tanacetum coccineum]
MFDEYFTHPSIAVSLLKKLLLRGRADGCSDSHVSIPIDQDALSSKSPSQGSSSNVRQIHTPFEYLVDPGKRLKIERCNARIAFTKPQKEETYQVTLEVLKLSLCYPAFQISAEVPEIYMCQFWNTINKIGNTDAYNFKLDKKKCRVDTKVFREILQICPRLPNQEFDDLPSEDDLVSFIKELDYSGNYEMLFAIRTDQMHQPWRTFVTVINRCISGKSTGLDMLRESRAQIL